MKDVTAANFGLLIAFLLPGFVMLWGIGEFLPAVHAWFVGAPEQGPSVGGFLYVTLGAVSAGLFVSTVRWLVIDTIHHRTGIMEPSWNFATLNQNLAAFEMLVASHYRFYQAYANMAVAVVLTFAAAMVVEPDVKRNLVWSLVILVAVETVLWLGSRDTLRKYYRRAEALMVGESADRAPVARSEPITRAKRVEPVENLRKIRLKIEGPLR